MASSQAATSSDRGRFASQGRDRSLGRAAGSIAAAILTAACGVHIYWALGGEWAAATAYGSTDLPSRGIVAVVAALIAGAVVLILRRIGALKAPLPYPLLRWGPWALVAVFALAGISSLAAPEDSYARDWHVFFFGPLLLLVAIFCAVVARSPLPDARRR